MRLGTESNHIFRVFLPTPVSVKTGLGLYCLIDFYQLYSVTPGSKMAQMLNIWYVDLPSVPF